MAQAVVHHRAGRLAEAQKMYLQILAIDVRHADTLHLLGMIENELGHPDIAVKLIRRAITHNGKDPLYYSNLGFVLEIQGLHDEAVTACKQALKLQPNFAEALNNLGNSLESLGLHDEAAATCQRALKLKPDFAEAYNNLGNALASQYKLDEALDCYQQALTLRPVYAEAIFNRGNALKSQGKLGEAMVCYEQALALKPDYADAHWNRSLLQLLQGEFASGWRNYEWRWMKTKADMPFRAFEQPRWKGEKLASGRLLIWGEQGVGDEIIFAGLISDALRCGNRCVLDCDPRLQSLFVRSFPTIEVVSKLRPEDASGLEIAAQLPSGSLPALFRNSEAAFAATKSPYLAADPAARNQFRSKYADGRLLVGVAWYTKNRMTGRTRSLDLKTLAPLFTVSEMQWVSLQYGDFDELEGQATQAIAPILIDRAVNQMADIDLFAAQIAAMDLVITIDNSTAHLAGALGVPVWLLLPFMAEFRWFLEREDSPWYPTMRLFRQPRLGDWPSVVENVRAALFKKYKSLPERREIH